MRTHGAQIGQADAQRHEGCSPLAAATSHPNSTKPLLKAAAPYLDYISIHGYWDPLFHVNNPTSFIDCMMKTDAPEQRKLKVKDGQVMIPAHSITFVTIE